MEFGPASSKEVLMLADPAPVSVPVPNTVPPSLKMTVPVGVPTRPGVICAVKMMDCPSTEELRDEVSAVVVETGPVAPKMAKGESDGVNPQMRLLIVSTDVVMFAGLGSPSA